MAGEKSLIPGQTYVLARINTEGATEYLSSYERLSVFRSFSKTIVGARTHSSDHPIFHGDQYAQARQGLLIMRLYPINVGSFAPIEYERVT